MPASRKVEFGFFLALLLAAATLSFFILKPYLSALFIAAIISIAFYPVHAAVRRRIRLESAAALVTLLLLFLAVLIPATLFGFFVFEDARELYTAAIHDARSLDALERFIEPVERALKAFFPAMSLDVSAYVRQGLSFLVGNLGSVFSGAVHLAIQFFVVLLALYVLLRNGSALHAFILRLSPLANEYDERILARLRGAINTVVKGKLLIVLIQGALAAVGFVIFGVPYPMLWSVLVLAVALIPAVGPSLVFVPLAAYFFLAGQVGTAVGLFVWGLAGVSVIDNLLSPILLEKGLDMHPLLILLSVLGGLAFFGPIGFLAGPVTLALFFALLDLYPALIGSNGGDTPRS